MTTSPPSSNPSAPQKERSPRLETGPQQTEQPRSLSETLQQLKPGEGIVVAVLTNEKNDKQLLFLKTEHRDFYDKVQEIMFKRAQKGQQETIVLAVHLQKETPSILAIRPRDVDEGLALMEALAEVPYGLPSSGDLVPHETNKSAVHRLAYRLNSLLDVTYKLDIPQGFLDTNSRWQQVLSMLTRDANLLIIPANNEPLEVDTLPPFIFERLFKDCVNLTLAFNTKNKLLALLGWRGNEVILKVAQRRRLRDQELPIAA